MMGFRVEDHVLASPTVDVEFLGRGGAPIVPEVIVLHYGVTHSLDALVAAQRARGYWAHLSIDGYQEGGRGGIYRVTQAIPFNERGSHAGQSTWKGRPSVNGFSIGIEISNPGPLVERGGELLTTYGKQWPREEATKARHKFKRSPPAWNHWAIYTDQEVDLLVDVCVTLCRAYPTIADIVGHDDIAPGRKFDPGPAMPLEWLRGYVFNVVNGPDTEPPPAAA